MRNLAYLIILGIFFPVAVFCQNPLWTVGTAKTLPKRNVEINIIEPSRYGLTKTFELSAHPVAFFVIPHLTGKKMWLDKVRKREKKIFSGRRFMISTAHGLNFPTLLLRQTQKRGFFDLIPNDSIIPGILSMKNEFLLSTFLKPRSSCESEDYLLTFRLGVKRAFPFKETTMPAIKKTVLYRETIIYHKKLMWYTGLDLEWTFTDWLNLSTDAELYVVGKFDDLSFEHKLLGVWHFSEKMRACLGYKFSFNTYPGVKKISFMPMFDITWRFVRKGGNNDLFEDGIYNPFDDPKERM